MRGRDLGHVCREGMGQPGTGISLQRALGCPELCLATGVSSWHTPAPWARASPCGMFWDAWSSGGHSDHPMAPTGIPAWAWGLHVALHSSVQSSVWARGSPHGALQAAQSSCQAQCQDLR